MSNQSDDARRAWWSAARASILLGGAHAAVSIVILVITILVLVGQEAGDQKGVGTDTPRYFISAEDRKRREEIGYRWVNISKVMSVDEDCKEVKGDMCYTEVTYHGCCRSSPAFVSPTNVTDIHGHQQHLVSGQLFPTEICSQMENCTTNCNCTMEDGMFQGKITCYEWIWFLLPSCCKCLN
ncbi:hypothetical protein KP79_PYT02738 [Mizuhopecten yessoensis]|uniref:Uncharacterized protein n=1 Tax=Mizuhopecten yessoensis TaxID=6573 RepID=A0A210PK38_MIZYE|nr:hypothetical protein KP79_PYT02738 [Mizuhopecten yessoensis]